MLPTQLKPADFAAYPPRARAFATEHLTILQQVPLSLLPSLLNEVIGFDWKLPAERAQIDRQVQWLGAMSPAQLADRTKEFAGLRLSADLEAIDWVNVPSSFLEQLTAWLWSTQQMDAFHAAADSYTAKLAEAAPTPAPAMPRLAIVIVGKGVEQTSFRPFSKLRAHGTYFTKIKPDGGVDAILAHASARAQKNPEKAAFAHWYVDGGTAEPTNGLTQISYDALAPARSALLGRTQQTISSGTSGPEALRSLLAQMKPQDVGLATGSDREVLNHFQLSLLTQGSGTQIFSTTFVQWAGRECLRRAQPSTLVLRYAPRQEQQPMNAMLSGAPIEGGGPKSDPEGSLIDADMGAYYTWLNLQRLPGSDQSRFLAWFEGHSQAIAIGPDLPRGTVSDSSLNLAGVLRLLA
ncbi:hypothetical protein HDF16_003131 [Granulicella aggregans]|uniref:Uncharacterized protein n=1 Tax=Granulicella aggregans TaxID=474949 RepID=A0A7W7ZEP7_9BACT|nr:hypothetical protein [Granulicella aggregans]MBB5058417.1 hypothetical protein [Granulicella aggregans]